jgi:hypothetical protein
LFANPALRRVGLGHLAGGDSPRGSPWNGCGWAAETLNGVVNHALNNSENNEMAYNALTRAVGVPVVRLFRRLPISFPIVCSGGIAVGVVLVRFASLDPHPLITRSLGVAVLIFYCGLALMWTAKTVRGEWTAFCDWWLEVLESLPD